MPIWILMVRYQGEMCASSHLTEKGCLLAAIEDLVCALAPDDLETFFADRDVPEDERKDHPPTTRDELKKLDSDGLRRAYRIWSEYMWDDYDYDVDVHKTMVQA